MSAFVDVPIPALTDEDLAADAFCCMGAIDRGPESCTCWRPIFDLEQEAPETSCLPATRVKCCIDCAYRQGSPEREDEEGRDLDDLAGSAGETFWCHLGLRRAVRYRHPDGRERPARPGDYQPPIVDGVPYRADGSAAARCAGWAAVHRSLLGPDPPQTERTVP